MKTANIDLTNEIVRLAKKLSPLQQKLVVKNLKKELILEQARKLDGSVIKNNITMDEIVREVDIVRKKRYEQKSSNN